MLEWLFGRKEKSPSTSASPQAFSGSRAKSSDDAAMLLAALPPETRPVLAGLAARLHAMAVTPPKAAEEELEDRNVSRRKIWGSQAIDVPIQRGDAKTAHAALLRCLEADHRLAEVMRIAVEEVPAPSAHEADRVERAREQLDQMRPKLRARYEKRFIKHLRKSGEAPTDSGGAIRKIVVTVYLRETFARHEILRVAADEFFVMVCTKR